MSGKRPGDGTAISWTHLPGYKGVTWNATVGCSRVSAGCDHCYAFKLHDDRYADNLTAARARHHQTIVEARDAGSTLPWPVQYDRPFSQVQVMDERITQPLHWAKPRAVFVDSMADLFHEDVPDEVLDRIWAVMALTPQHVYMILTKRPERMRAYVSREETPHRVAREMDRIAAAQKQPIEERRPVVGFPGYEVSNRGVIYSSKRGPGRALAPDSGPQGHQRVTLYREGSPEQGERQLVHRMVLEAFLGAPPDADAQGRHRDGDPSNNAVGNLSWGSQGDNWDDSKRHGTHRRYSKLSVEDVEQIRKRLATGESAYSIAGSFGVSDTQIRNISSGRQWATDSPIEWPLPRVWLGTSVEDQAAALARIPMLLDTPAAVRFLSCEPLLGPLALRNLDVEAVGRAHNLAQPIGMYFVDALTGRNDDMGRPCPDVPAIDWVICGGESGPGFRPMDERWAADLRAQCLDARVPFFYKQTSAYRSGQPGPPDLDASKAFPQHGWNRPGA